MNGTEVITYLGHTAPSLLSAVAPIAGSIITAVFLRNNTAASEFEKIKAGKFDEVIEELLASGQMTYTEFYKAKNFLEIAKKADEQYPYKQQNNKYSSYDFDWFMRYYEAAGNVSDNEMQDIWAKVLAGEINYPSFFSYRTIDVLRNMRKSDAELFVKFCKFSFDAGEGKLFLPNYDEYLKESGITYSDIMRLSEMGLIFNEGLIALKFDLTEEPQIVLVNRELIMTLAVQAKMSPIGKIKQYPFTQVGRELATLVSDYPSDESFISLGKQLDKYGDYRVGIHRIVQIAGEAIEYEDTNILEQ